MDKQVSESETNRMDEFLSLAQNLKDLKLQVDTERTRSEYRFESLQEKHQKDVDILEGKLSKAKQHHSTELFILKDKISANETHINELKIRLDLSGKENDKLKKSMRIVQAQLVSEKNKSNSYHETLKTVQDQLKTVREESDSYREALKIVQDQLKTARDESDSYREALKTVQDQLKTAREESDSYHEALKTVQDQLKITQDQLKTAREESDSYREALKTVQDQLKITQDQLKTAREESDSYREALKTVQDQLKITQDQLKTVQDQLESAKEESDSYREALKTVQDDLEDLRQYTLPLVLLATRIGKAQFMRAIGMRIATLLASKDKKMKEYLGRLKDDHSTQTLKEFYASLDKNRLRLISFPPKYDHMILKDYSAIIDQRNQAAHPNDEELASLLDHPLADGLDASYRDL